MESGSRMSVVSGHMPGHAPNRMSVVSGHLPGGPAPSRMSVVSGHLPGGHAGIRMSFVSGHVGGHSSQRSRKSRIPGMGSALDQNLPSNTNLSSNAQDDKESGEGFRQRVHRLADRLADEHESELRQLHMENASLRKRCGLPAAQPAGSAPNGSVSSLPALPEGSQMKDPEPHEDASPTSSNHSEGEVDGFGLNGEDGSHADVERQDSSDLSSARMENGEDTLCKAAHPSVEAEAQADPESENLRQSENGEACPQPSDNLDGCLPGCIRDCNSPDQKGSNHSLTPVSDGAGEQTVLPVDSGLQDFIKSANLAVDAPEADSCDGHSSMCASDFQCQQVEANRESECYSPEPELEEFELRVFWKDQVRRTEFAQMARTLIAEDTQEHDRNFMLNIEDDDFDGCIKRVISYPSSIHRLLWDIMGMGLILYDIIVIPLEAFDPGSNTFTDTMNWVTLLFWTLDMVSSFFVGYMDKGVTVLHPWKIAKNYVQTWFFVDVIVVGSDWAFMIVNSTQSNLGSLGRLLKILRAIRTLRLVRLLKLKKLMELVNDYIDSEHVAIAVSVCRLVCLLLMSSHFIACTWYLIGNTSRGYGSPNWIDRFAKNPDQLSYRYFTSMHWSLTQFTPASIDVQPQNVAERTFAIIILIFALITFSSFLSTITSSMSQLHAMKEDTMRQFWLLRRFLRERQVPKVLALRIQRYVEYAWQNQNNTVQETKVKMLTLLSDQLRGELRSATTEPHLNTHPLFQLINTASNVLIQRLSITAIDWRLLADSDSVFFAGETANYMYHVVTGELQYIKGFDPRWVYNGEWICEPVLWTDWVHLGELRSFTECDLINIDAAKFGETVRTNPMMQRLVRAYAERYVCKLNKFDARVLSDVEDMMHVGDDEVDKVLKAEGIVFQPEKSERTSFDPRISQYRQSRYGRRSMILTGGRGSSGKWGSEASEPGCESETAMSSVSKQTARFSLESLEHNPAAQDQIKKSLTGRKSLGEAAAEIKAHQVVPTDSSAGVRKSLQDALADPMEAARASLRESLKSSQIN